MLLPNGVVVVVTVSLPDLVASQSSPPLRWLHAWLNSWARLTHNPHTIPSISDVDVDVDDMHNAFLGPASLKPLR